MQNILLLFARFGTHISFVFFTILSFILIVNFNQNQRSIFINSSNYYSNKLDAKTSKWQSYLNLQEVNDSLSRHNAELLEKFINLTPTQEVIKDTTKKYQLIPANIIRKTYNLRNNHFTLNKGSKDGVRKDMGVIAENGILGIVRNVSQHYAHVVSVLNSQARISCTVKPYAYPASLVWKDLDPYHMTLESIPKHVEISVGDTVTTNGYSTIFPQNIDVGIIESFNVDGGSSNFEIKVKLFNNIPNASKAFIILNTQVEEQIDVEALGDE